MVKRVNLFSGPGASKSTMASKLYSYYKELGLNVELVREYVKDWAYENKKPTGFDQFYITVKQLHREEIPLKAGVDFIITDSPILLGCIYANDSRISTIVKAQNEIFELDYPSVNIFLNREDRPYNTSGRFQTLEQAKQIDESIKNFLQSNNIAFKEFSYKEIDQIISYLKEFNIG